MSYEEKIALVLFVLATVLAFTRQLYQSILPGLKPAYVFIICAIVSFLLTNKSGERIMVWKNVQGKIIWGLMYIFAGGLAAGTRGRVLTFPLIWIKEFVSYVKNRAPARRRLS